mmetsp:Transcript_14529/g.32556  ORF Transcript_14529/g.32556 Transcript_14529/m.32556 type:complete len:160 (-) Transcript_14529:179-658(-)
MKKIKLPCQAHAYPRIAFAASLPGPVPAPSSPAALQFLCHGPTFKPFQLVLHPLALAVQIASLMSWAVVALMEPSMMKLQYGKHRQSSGKSKSIARLELLRDERVGVSTEEAEQAVALLDPTSRADLVPSGCVPQLCGSAMVKEWCAISSSPTSGTKPA